jgi:hypothetical protein
MSSPPPISASHASLPANASLAGAAGLDMHRVCAREEWARVRALRYTALRARGEIPENPLEAWRDDHDTALNAATFLLASNGRPMGSTRSSVRCADRRWPLPSFAVFAREIEAALGADATLVEGSLTVVDPSCVSDPKVLLFHLFKAHMLSCAAHGADWLLVAVRECQMGFYRRMFNMEILTGAEPMPGLASPRVVMGLKYRDQAALLAKRLPVLAASEAEVREFSASGTITFGARRA